MDLPPECLRRSGHWDFGYWILNQQRRNQGKLTAGRRCSEFVVWHSSPAHEVCATRKQIGRLPKLPVLSGHWRLPLYPCKPESKINPMQPRYATNFCTLALPEDLLRTVTYSMDQLCHVPACNSSREHEIVRVSYSAKDAWPLNPLGLRGIFFRGADDTCSFPGHGPATEQHAEETGCRNHDKRNLRIANRRCCQCMQPSVECILQSLPARAS